MLGSAITIWVNFSYTSLQFSNQIRPYQYQIKFINFGIPSTEYVVNTTDSKLEQGLSFRRYEMYVYMLSVDAT